MTDVKDAQSCVQHCVWDNVLSLQNRVVFDTSTLISALRRPLSVPRQAFMSALGIHTSFVYHATLDELEQVLLRPKFDACALPAARAAFFVHYKLATTLLASDAQSVITALSVCRNPKDCKFLALAMACKAGTLITSDDYRLCLKSWSGTHFSVRLLFLARTLTDISGSKTAYRPLAKIALQ